MRASPAPFALLLALLLVASASAPARGDDAPADESAASKTYRDAWWAETGGGNLTQALDLYAQAAASDGPAAVRARALYRRAVVLQRIGKTEEAIRTLEGLAKDFPGEAQPNADARARLAEWTAVDLRSSFSEWFKRYQYSPEFQAKVVDLVLKLGGSDATAAAAAEAELLTIGAASIPALEEHVASKNAGLASRAQRLLLLLGKAPDAVVEPANSGWGYDARTWSALLALPEARREALRARVGTGTWWSDALRAALTGPDAVVALLATPGDPGQGTIRRALLLALASALPTESPLRVRLADLAVAEGQSDEMRQALGEWALRHTRLGAERVKAWASHPSLELRRLAWGTIDAGQPVPPAEAWPLVLAAVERYGGKQWTDEQGLGLAFLRTLDAAPWPGDLDRAAAALLKAGGRLDTNQPPARYAETLARAFELAKDPSAGARALAEWRRFVPGDVATLDRLATWSRSAEPAWRRKSAAASLIALGSQGDNLRYVVDLLADASVRADDMRDAWQLFFSNYPGTVEVVLADANALRRLLDRLLALGDAAAELRRSLAGYVTAMPPNARALQPDALMGLLVAAPERTPWEILHNGNLAKALRVSGGLDRWRAEWRAGWSRWDAKQRTAALGLAASLLSPGEDAESVAFLRARLRARPVEIEPEARYRALALLGPLTLDDLTAVYDLSKNEDVDEAVSWALRSGNGDPPRLAPSTPVFRALRLALRPDGKPEVARALGTLYGGAGETDPELIPALLAHADASLHRLATDQLLWRSAPADEALWVRALTDRDVETRTRAATGMQRVPTDAVRRALVGALDDPHPDVRAAALASLESIQKLDELKARWREKVK